MPTVIGNLNFHVYQAESVLFTKLGWISPEMKEKLLQYDMAVKIVDRSLNGDERESLVALQWLFL